jgi:hypothetical protein
MLGPWNGEWGCFQPEFQGPVPDLSLPPCRGFLWKRQQVITVREGRVLVDGEEMGDARHSITAQEET